MSTFYLTRIEPETNVRRYYLVSVAASILGEYSVLREWGRWIAGHCRRLSPQTFGSQAEALGYAWRLVNSKLKRGYCSDSPALALLAEEVEMAG